MAVNSFAGDAAAVAQVHRFTIQHTWTAADTATLKCGRKSVTFAAPSTSHGAIAAGLVAAWNASTEPELAEVTASSTSGGAVISLTADTAGVSFVASTTWVTATTADIAGPTTGTANAGPECWDTATNWSLCAVPTTADDVRLENSNVNILYGLAVATAPLTLDIRQSYTGKIGLPRVNAGGDYLEYREDYLTFPTTTHAMTVDIGEGEGDGSGRIKIDMGVHSAVGSTGARTINIYNKGTREDADVPCVLLKGSTGSTGDALNINKGDVGLAFYGGETAKMTTIKLGFISNRARDAKLVCGSGAAHTTITKTGGELEVNADVTTLTQGAGKTRVNAGTVVTANANGGTLFYNSPDSTGPTTINVNGGATLDYREDMRSKAAPTDVNLYQGAKLLDPGKTGTWDANINLVQCGISDVTVDLGEGITLSAT